MAKRVELTVTIGNRSREFVLVRTNAPPAYDHNAALMVRDATYRTSKPDGSVTETIERYLLLDAKSVEWQIGRNASGLFETVTDPEELMIDANVVAGMLWDRFEGRS